jgi:putative integral membrane protein (TIGR02587 family)
VSARASSVTHGQFGLGLVRAVGGAILFSFPMLMTMEMWGLGSSIDPLRLAIFLLLGIPLLIALSHHGGFEPHTRRQADVLDAFTAYAVGYVVAAVVLLLFAVIGPGMSAEEVIGKISVQALPASIGALLARSQFGEGERSDEQRRRESYGGGLFLMAVGAVFLCSSLASTEEMMLISYQMTPGHAVGLMAFSLLVMHGFVQAAVLRGETPAHPADPPWNIFLRHTMVGYGIALLVGLFMLWTFGRLAGLAPEQVVEAMVVLGFPAAIGAGAARLIL